MQQVPMDPINDKHTAIDEEAEVKSELLDMKQKTSIRCPLRSLSNACHIIPNHGKSTQIRYAAFKYKTSHKVWPLQAPALKNLDDLLEKENDSISTSNSNNRNISELSTAKNLAKEIHNGQNSLWSTEPRIFAMEEPTSGKRRYVTCHLGRFMHHYWRGCDSSSRHYYELIREGTPCRLYFDLEFSKPANPQIKANEIETLLNELVKELCTELRTVFNITISRKNIVDLESSTEAKFSRHFMVHLPKGELFADAVECGVFVKSFVGRLAEEVATGELHERSPVLARCLFVYSQVSKPAALPPQLRSSIGSSSTDDETHRDEQTVDPSSKISQQASLKGPSIGTTMDNSRKKTCFIDIGVYTRNRIFRLMGSVKYGKSTSAALRVSSTNQFPFQDNFGNEHFFSRSLEPNDSNGIPEDDIEKHATALADTFVVPINRLPGNEGILPKLSVDSEFAHLSGRNAPIPQRGNRTFPQNSVESSSSFPALDKFVANVLGIRGGTQGYFRKCEIGYDTSNESNLSHSMITYQMIGNRWCEHINRSHKSNNIMWIVSIRRMQYWQGCYDPECNIGRFRGQINDLPVDIQDSIKDVLLEDAVDVDDEFEKALAALCLDKVYKGADDTQGCSSSAQTFVEGENQELDSREQTISKKVTQAVNDLIIDHTSNQPTVEGKKKSSDVSDDRGEESFDGEFGAALLDALSSNPNFCP